MKLKMRKWSILEMTDEITAIFRKQFQIFFASEIKPHLNKIYQDINFLKNSIKSVENIPAENEVFFDKIVYYLEHIRNFEEKLYKEYEKHNAEKSKNDEQDFENLFDI